MLGWQPTVDPHTRGLPQWSRDLPEDDYVRAMGRADRSRRRALAGFAAATVIAMVAVLALALWASKNAGTAEAIRDARSKTEVLAHAVAEPKMAVGLITSNPTAVSLMDALMSSQALGPDVARVKIWSADGTIVYSNEPRLIGLRYPLGEEEQSVLRSGGLEAEVSDLSKPENRFEQSVGEMLEVYLPIRSPEGQPLLFEAYYSYDSVTASAQRIWTQFAPIVTGGILLFGLLLLPLVWRLTSRLQRDQIQKERLLQSAIDASNNERSRIASDLHDGVVQDLSGLALTLAGVGANLPPDSEEAAQVLTGAQHTRGAVRALRSLLVEIYPPNLKDAGIENALLGLTASLDARGIKTTLDMEPTARLSDQTEALVFRVAQESLRNVVRHAQALSVAIQLKEIDGTTVLTVTDDGVGVTDDALENPEPGHVGLRLLATLVNQACGTLTVAPGPTGGTRVRLELPTQ